MDLEILKIASNTENHKIINDHTHKSKQKNPLCGDEMEIALKVKNNKIIDFGYQCKSCVYCQASVSLLSLKSINQPIEKVKEIVIQALSFFEKNDNSFSKEWVLFNKLLDKKNISRKECLLLPFKALSKALNFK
ncbi:MAG: iron-sulfur cluster assembly scaffold protein [Pelagibacteraceae bacterium TMED268]|nr:MAG: iron-sulfur cluster assembly scaffold protein [Pelagibacteraceae bacterium TMED268]